MFNKLMKNDLVAYSDNPKSIPLGIVKSVEEKMGKAVVMVYVLDTFFEDEIGTVKCVPYHKLDLVSRAEKV
ncbi:MAG: hypothetical protein CL429_03860 [Acidimicrobiaceae bacterium]|mgnify:CR=1 FL=1|nr:hypothetical protein [Acidimicrobiaceae bacterium]